MCPILVEVATLVALLGPALLDWGARAQAGFIYANASRSPLAGAAEGDFTLGNEDLTDGNVLPFVDLPTPYHLPGQGGGACGNPSTTACGSPSFTPSLAGLPHHWGCEQPQSTRFLSALEAGCSPVIIPSFIFRPPR